MADLALGVALASVVALVVVGRWPAGGWVRRFGYAAPCALVAGFAQAVVLADAGWSFPWWLVLIGIAVAGVLPLTRRQRRTSAPAPVQAAVAAGYEVVEEFTRTESAVVYRAVHAERGAALVKVIAAERGGDPAARLRLWSEAQVLGGLRHPHCVRLRETLGEARAPVLVLEGADAAPLSSLWQRSGGLSAPQAVAVASGVLAGLAALHANGFVHRQVSPENVWLSADGQVALANFESACVGVEHAAAPVTGRYASPEQRSGEVLSGSADVWSCAAMLRELVGESLPAELAAVVQRALADDPAQRPSAADFAESLTQVAAQQWGPRWRDRAALGAALAAHGVIGAGVAGWLAGGAGGSGSAAGDGGSAALSTAPGGGSAGLGAAPGSGPAGAAPSTAAPSTAAPSTAAPSTAAPAGAAPSAAAPAVPAGAVTTAATAVVAAAVVITVGVTVQPAPADPPPAPAPVAGATDAPAPPPPDEPPGQPVLPPSEAEQIFRQVFGADAPDGSALAQLRDDAGELGDPDGLTVGVSCDAAAPAWFVVSAEAEAADGPVRLFVRVEQQADDEWELVTLLWSAEESLFAPQVTAAGCVAPGPDPTELTVDPAQIPQLYEELLAWELDVTRPRSGPLPPARQILDRVHGEDTRYRSVLRLVGSLTGVVRDREMDSTSYSYEVGEVDSVVPLGSGVVIVTFPATVHVTWYNRPNQATGPCTEHVGGDRWISSYMSPQATRGSWGQTSSGIAETGHEPWVREDGARQVDFRYQVRATAWVPTHGNTRADVPYSLGDDNFPARAVVLDDHTPNVTTVPC